MSESPKKTRKNTAKLTPLETSNTSLLLGQTSRSIQRKKDLIEAVRRINPAGLNSAPTIFWDVEGSLKNTVIDSSGVGQQLVIIENGVNYSARRYNDLRVENDRLTKVLKVKLDELDEQKKNFESLDAMKNATTEEGMRIEHLQKEIKEVEEDIARKQHYTRQLEYVLLRLKKNQLRFDAHMTGMEEAMKSVQKEGVEVRLLRKGLDAGLAKAVLVLEQTQANLAVARKDRECLIAQRRGEVKNAKLLQEWMKERELIKKKLAIELRGDLTRDEETFLRSQISDKVENRKSLQKANEDSLKQLQAMEESFAQIKQITGVSSLEEMHEKFSSQKNNRKALEQEVKEAETKLLAAKKAFAKKEKGFQDLKSSGGSIAELTREMTSKLEDSITIARNEHKLTKAGIGRLESVLLGLHQGGSGLKVRIQPYLNLAEAGVFSLTQADDASDGITPTLDSLTTAEQVLAKMLELIVGAGEGQGSPKVNNYDDFLDDEASIATDNKSMSTRNEAPNFSSNVRIMSKKYKRETELAEELAPALDNEGGKTGTVNDLGDEADAKLGKSTVNIPNMTEDPAIPTRILVKKNALRTSQEFTRKQEMEIRRKKLLEVQKLGKSGEDDAGMALAAKLKTQNAMANRLCTIKSNPTLPDGITLRDDIMTKTTAFIEKMPKLA